MVESQVQGQSKEGDALGPLQSLCQPRPHLLCWGRDTHTHTENCSVWGSWKLPSSNKTSGGKIAKQDQDTGHSLLLPRPGVARRCRARAGPGCGKRGARGVRECRTRGTAGMQPLFLCTALGSGGWSVWKLHVFKQS